MTAPAFAASRYELGGTRAPPLVLYAGVGAEAERLAAAFAAIDPWARYPYPASALAAYFAADEPAAPRFAVHLGDDLAAVAGLRLNWLRGPYVQFLGVLPAFQRNGIGSTILGWIEEETRRAAERNLWVMASDFNDVAIAFYGRHGFAEAARIPDLVRDRRTEVLLRKRLVR
jgi:GNAT superfamily N-acetyltransferase